MSDKGEKIDGLKEGSDQDGRAGCEERGAAGRKEDSAAGRDKDSAAGCDESGEKKLSRPNNPRDTTLDGI